MSYSLLILTGMHYGCRHQGLEETDGTEITEEQYDKSAKKNVERWVSAHIIPVRPRYRCCPQTPISSRNLN